MLGNIRRTLARIERLAAQLPEGDPRRRKAEHLLAVHLYPLDRDDDVIVCENGECRVVTREEASRLEASADLLVDHVSRSD